MFVYQNGEILSKDQVKVSAFDHGFLYGVGLFETFRVCEGHAFLLEDHLDRLNKGLKELLIDKVFTKEEVETAITLLLQSEGYQNAYIRFNVSAGYGELGLQVEPYEQPSVIIYTKPLPAANNQIQEKSAQLLNIKRNTPEGHYRLKSHHFLNNVLAKREIGNRADVEGIFLTQEGYLAEGVVSNLFWMKDQKVFTPSIETGILNGITRGFIIHLLKHFNIEVEEGFYEPESLENADEIFITNSIQEVVALKQVGNREYPGRNGELVQFLHKEYRSYCSKLFSRYEVR